MPTPDREGICANCGDPIRKRPIRDNPTLDGKPHAGWHYTCGNCLDPTLAEDNVDRMD